jgi:hypothetical protein
LGDLIGEVHLKGTFKVTKKVSGRGATTAKLAAPAS